MKHTAAFLGLCSILMLASAQAATETPAKSQTPPTSQAGSTAAGAPAVPPAATPPGHTATAPKQAPAKEPPKVDLNNASKKELMTLPSVGEAEADKIIAKRPYISKVDLVTKAGLPEGVYVAVRDKVVVNDMKKKPAAKNVTPQK